MDHMVDSVRSELINAILIFPTPSLPLSSYRLTTLADRISLYYPYLTSSYLSSKLSIPPATRCILLEPSESLLRLISYQYRDRDPLEVNGTPLT